MKNIKLPRKAIIPVAGFATRFLPQTKAMPKQMLPLVDKPIIQYIVEDLVAAGIKDIIFVTSSMAKSIEDHFDKPSLDLVENLKMGGPKKMKYLEEIEKISNLANFIYIRQSGTIYGNGIPLLNAAHLINNEPFIYTWGDDMFKSKPNEFIQIIDKYRKYGKSCLSCVCTGDVNDYEKYAFIGGKQVEDGVIHMDKMIEKPGKDRVRSEKLRSLGVVSSMLFTPEVFRYLELALKKYKKGKEFYYTDIITEMLEDNKKIYGIEIKNGKYLDVGNKLDYLKAVVEFGCGNKAIGKDFKTWLKEFSDY
jgi:UTP--glucose-1-phosphate uridylyltransferase